MPSTPDHVMPLVMTQRMYLEKTLSSLDAAQWDSESLCDGWTVRHVVSHLLMPYSTKPLTLLITMARSGFRFARAADRLATSDQRTPDELLEALRTNIDNRWSPPGGDEYSSLSHDVIHGLDITVPLGMAGPADECLLPVLSDAPKRSGYFGVDLSGMRLRATDLDWTHGSGEEKAATGVDHLLFLTGRRPLADR